VLPFRAGTKGGARKERLTLDLDSDLYLCVRLAAAQQHISMCALIEHLLQERLPSLALLARLPEERLRPVSAESLACLAAAREAVMCGRQFAESSADLIRESREERTRWQ
jgi:hypothetical protein